jgi:hypothetical protein
VSHGAVVARVGRTPGRRAEALGARGAHPPGGPGEDAADLDPGALEGGVVRGAADRARVRRGAAGVERAAQRGLRLAAAVGLEDGVGRADHVEVHVGADAAALGGGEPPDVGARAVEAELLGRPEAEPQRVARARSLAEAGREREQRRRARAVVVEARAGRDRVDVGARHDDAVAVRAGQLGDHVAGRALLGDRVDADVDRPRAPAERGAAARYDRHRGDPAAGAPSVPETGRGRRVASRSSTRMPRSPAFWARRALRRERADAAAHERDLPAGTHRQSPSRQPASARSPPTTRIGGGTSPPTE